MRLYGEIIFLKTYFTGVWVIENVKPYYEPLINPSFELQRHYFWSSGTVPYKDFSASHIRSKNKISDFDGSEIVAASNIKNKRQVLRNCVDPEVGQYIYDSLCNKQLNQTSACGLAG